MEADGKSSGHEEIAEVSSTTNMTARENSRKRQMEDEGEKLAVFGATPEMSNLCLKGSKRKPNVPEIEEKVPAEETNPLEEKDRITRKATKDETNTPENYENQEKKDRNKKENKSMLKLINPDKSFHQGLEHAVRCLEAYCPVSNCHVLKQFLMHQVTCVKKTNAGCSICHAFDAIVFKHSEECQVRLHENCPVPNCDKSKIKILEKWMKIKVIHNSLMQKAFKSLSHARICSEDSCQFRDNCRNMKLVLKHVKNCARKGICSSKKFLHALCQNHKVICKDLSCPVDFCQEKFGSNVAVENVENGEINQGAAAISLDVMKRQNGKDIEMAKSLQRSTQQPLKSFTTLTHLPINKDYIVKDGLLNNLSEHIMTSKQPTFMMDKSNGLNRRPYSFGDPRQMPSANLNQNIKLNSYWGQNNKGRSMENGYYQSLDERSNKWHADTRDPFMPAYYQPNVLHCNTHKVTQRINDYQYDEQKYWMANEIQPPKDYAAMQTINPMNNANYANYSNNDEGCVFTTSRSYSLWPTGENYLQSHFSPRELQNILLAKNTTKLACRYNDDDISKNTLNNITNENLGLGKEFIDDDGIHTPDQFMTETTGKGVNCVRRLFPTNKGKQFPDDSDTDSELCKNLSQESGSPSGSSDQQSVVF